MIWTNENAINPWQLNKSILCTLSSRTTNTIPPSDTSQNGIINIPFWWLYTNYLFIYHTFHSYSPGAFSIAFIYENRTQPDESYIVASLHTDFFFYCTEYMSKWNLPVKSIDFITITFTFFYDFSESCFDFCLKHMNFVCMNFMQFEYIILAHSHTSENDGGVVEIEQNGTSSTPIPILKQNVAWNA